jgi:adenylate cyclase class IV
MSRNVEIKACIENIEDLERKVVEIADDGPREIIQDDTFFNCRNGRIKLRTFSDVKGELNSINVQMSQGQRNVSI